MKLIAPVSIMDLVSVYPCYFELAHRDREEIYRDQELQDIPNRPYNGAQMRVDITPGVSIAQGFTSIR